MFCDVQWGFILAIIFIQVRTSAHDWIAQFNSSLPKEEKESEENEEVEPGGGDHDVKKSVEVTGQWNKTISDHSVFIWRLSYSCDYWNLWVSISAQIWGSEKADRTLYYLFALNNGGC